MKNVDFLIFEDGKRKE